MKLTTKIKERIWQELLKWSRPRHLDRYLYRSYWNYILTSPPPGSAPVPPLYFTARPNPGAGIGHQLANWIAGYWYAKQFKLPYAYLPFSTPSWDHFLGFEQNETSVSTLKKRGYKTRKLPLFHQQASSEVNRIKDIIQSYAGRKVIFIAEQDQGYQEQYGVIREIKEKFHTARHRQHDRLLYSSRYFNIAIHVRRGDILLDPSNPNLTMRYLSNDYFEKVLQHTVYTLNQEKPIHLYFFSQGQPEDYPEFSSYENVHWCLDMTAQDSFLHMVYADLLITSKSSFSYKPALLSNGIKVCPRNFWHGYPDTKEWVLCDDDGTIPTTQLSKLT